MKLVERLCRIQNKITTTMKLRFVVANFAVQLNLLGLLRDFGFAGMSVISFIFSRTNIPTWTTATNQREGTANNDQPTNRIDLPCSKSISQSPRSKYTTPAHRALADFARKNGLSSRKPPKNLHRPSLSVPNSGWLKHAPRHDAKPLSQTIHNP